MRYYVILTLLRSHFNIFIAKIRFLTTVTSFLSKLLSLYIMFANYNQKCFDNTQEASKNIFNGSNIQRRGGIVIILCFEYKDILEFVIITKMSKQHKHFFFSSYRVSCDRWRCGWLTYPLERRNILPSTNYVLFLQNLSLKCFFLKKYFINL